MKALDTIRIVLVEAEHPGNIGATARAMANMGLTRLVLVAPLEFPSPIATARACGATSILERAQVTATLDEAIAECTMVVASTARARVVQWPEETPERSMQRLFQFSGQAALLFGRESTGLTNTELDRCHFYTRIPVSASCPSMNLGSAVSVMLYELRRQALAETGFERSEGSISMPSSQTSMGEERCTAADMRHFYAHLENALHGLDGKSANSPKRLRVLTRIFNRASLRTSEIQLLHGILGMIETKQNGRLKRRGTA